MAFILQIDVNAAKKTHYIADALNKGLKLIVPKVPKMRLVRIGPFYLRYSALSKSFKNIVISFKSSEY